MKTKSKNDAYEQNEILGIIQTKKETKGEIKIGHRYNKLTVLKEILPEKRSDGGTRRIIKCLCECGTIKNFRLYGLKHGKTKSCGCLRGIKPSSQKLPF